MPKKGLTIYVPKGKLSRPVRQAVRAINRQVAGKPLSITNKRKQANIVVTTGQNSSASRLPTRREAQRGQTKVTLNPRLRQLAAKPLRGAVGPKQVQKIAKRRATGVAAHELQHALGVTHKQMTTKAGKWPKGQDLTNKAKKKAAKVAGTKRKKKK